MAETKPTKQYFHAVGRRKSAIAQVRIFPEGTGKISINDKNVEVKEQLYLAPLRLSGKISSADLSIHVNGGGFQGQIEAIRHGIARALVNMDQELQTTLKKAGYLTRDPRERERKKFGLKSARRSPQWSKR
jgi:small subunit ribosomal protein S9